MNRHMFVFVLVLACLAAAGAQAESDISFKGIGPRLSYVSPEDVDGTIGLGATADMGTLAPGWGLQAVLDYWSKSEGSGDFEVKFRDIAIGVRTQRFFETESTSFKPYAAGGLSLHMLKVEIPESTIGTVTFGGSETESKIGIDLAGGAEFGEGEGMKFFGEVMYRIVSDVSQFVVTGGVMFPLGGAPTTE